MCFLHLQHEHGYFRPAVAGELFRKTSDHNDPNRQRTWLKVRWKEKCFRISKKKTSEISTGNTYMKVHLCPVIPQMRRQNSAVQGAYSRGSRMFQLRWKVIPVGLLRFFQGSYTTMRGSGSEYLYVRTPHGSSQGRTHSRKLPNFYKKVLFLTV